LLFFLFYLLLFGQLTLMGFAQGLGFLALAPTAFEFSEHFALAALVGIPAGIIFFPTFQSTAWQLTGCDQLLIFGLYSYGL
jgi:hypothetical protein